MKLQRGFYWSRIQKLLEGFGAWGSGRSLEGGNVNARLEVALAAGLALRQGGARRDLGSHARSCVRHQDLLLHEVKHRVGRGSSPGEVNAFLWRDHAEKFGHRSGACGGALLCVSRWVSFEQDALFPNFRLRAMDIRDFR